MCTILHLTAGATAVIALQTEHKEVEEEGCWSAALLIDAIILYPPLQKVGSESGGLGTAYAYAWGVGR